MPGSGEEDQPSRPEVEEHRTMELSAWQTIIIDSQSLSKRLTRKPRT